MGNLTYSSGRYWDASEAASIPAATLALVTSLNDRVVGKFTTATARNDALAGLTSTQKKGALAWVDGVGWTGHDGSASREVLSRDVNVRYGRTDTAIEGNGYARILSSACFFNNAPPSIIVATGINNLFDPKWDGFSDGSGALLKIWNPTANAYWGTGASVAFYWLAFR